MTLNRLGALFLSYKLGVHCLAGLETGLCELGEGSRVADTQKSWQAAPIHKL